MGIVVLLLFPALLARAEDTETLLNVYGLTLGGPIKSELEKEIGSLETDIASMQATQLEIEQYNAILKQYLINREAEVNKILTDVKVYQAQNDRLSTEIGDGILSSSMSDLLKLDNQYKTNQSYINQLLSAMNDMRVAFSYKQFDSNISDVEKQLEQTRTLYIESLDTYNLGDVTNIQYIMPNERYVTSSYGYRVDPINAGEIRFHAGTDYRAPEGTEIGALFNGEVIAAGWSEIIGYYITVQSGDNIKYLICHCSELLVEKGDLVKQYQPIALSGGTGARCTGPHLHLALYLNGVTYDVNQLFVNFEQQTK